jgi:hypothetical protein
VTILPRRRSVCPVNLDLDTGVTEIVQIPDRVTP